MNKMLKLFAVTLAAVAFVAVPVRALPTVNIDFQPRNGLVYSGVGMAADSGTFWNAMGIGAATDLMASDGATVTDIDVSSTYTATYANPSVANNDLLEDRLIWSPVGGPPAINISGLDAGLQYNVYLYAGYYGQTYTINGGSETLTGQGFTLDQPSWTEGIQYVSFLGVSPAGGTIDIDIYDTGIPGPYGTATVVSGMQIQAVPVPGALLLGSIGAGLVGWFRRRRMM